MRYTLAQLQTLAANAGFPDPALAASVAMAESCGNTCAQGDPNIGGTPCDTTDPAHSCAGPNGSSTSFGLWQIHQTAHREFDPTLLLDPRYNAQAAYAISQGGANWTPWSTFNHGLNAPYNVPFAPAPLPASPPAPTPPSKVRGAPVAIVAVGALALAAAAGYAARTARARGRYA
jgi:hypothetical protein